MSHLILQTADFLAVGAAWGMAWLGCFGIIKGDLSSISLTRLVSLVFAIMGTIVAYFWIQHLFSEYNSMSPEHQSGYFSNFTGKNFAKNGGLLIIRLSPILLFYRGFRNSKMVTGIVGLCYVLQPYYSLIVAKFLG